MPLPEWLQPKIYRLNFSLFEQVQAINRNYRPHK